MAESKSLPSTSREPGERTREGTVKRPPNAMQESADESGSIIPDQTAEAGPLPLDQSNELDEAQKALRGNDDGPAP